MYLLHVWAIFAGVGALGLPLLIHWLSRPRPKRLALSTIRFVREAIQQKRAAHRLRDLIILALRVTAVALLAWAFARPLIGARPLVTADAGGAAVRVLMVDQSQSMAAVERGIAAFDRARPAAARYLQYQPDLRVNLLLAAARARAVLEQPSSNFAALRDELAGAAVRPERLDVQAAINAAAEMLVRSAARPDQRLELVIVSDFQRSNWSNVDFSPLPKETHILLESVAPAQTPANLAIGRVSAAGRVEQGQPARVEVEVGNYSPAARQVQVEVSVGSVSYRSAGLCPPRVKTMLAVDVVVPAAGWQAGEARLVGVEDALAADNVRPFVLHVRPPAVYALLTREPARPQPMSSHYLERALWPVVERDAQHRRVVRMDPMGLDRDAVAGADLLVLDHPGKLSAAQVNLLAGLMRRGRGMLYVAAEPVDAANLKLLAEAAGSDLKMPVEFMPARSDQGRKGLFLIEAKRDAAPFAVFGDSLPAALSSLRFSGGLESRPLAGGLADDVRATYSDRSACVVMTACGAGNLAVLNVDLAASNLPGSTCFVPLVGEVVGQLLAERRGDGGVACGEPMAAYLPADAGAAAGLKISGLGQGTMDLGALSEDGGFVLWKCGGLGASGVYSVKRDAQTVYAVAAAVPAAESNLETLDASVLKERLAGGRTVQFQSASAAAQQKDDLWAWILAACAGCILAEWLVLRVFRT